MRLHSTLRPLLQLSIIILLAPRRVFANPNPHPSEQAGFTFNELFARYDCSGTTCGYYGQLCCPQGEGCYTDAATIVSCTAQAAATAATGGSSGYWQYYTTTYTQTDLKTVTSVMSTYIGGASPAAATGSASCNYALNETPCGSICCASNQYCFQAGQCAPAPNGGSSGYYSTGTAVTTHTATQAPGAPLRPTSSGVLTTTATQSPTTTVPFVAPVATGANVTVTGAEATSSSGLSGGAIAGIVIGVLAALLLIGLLLFCCCVKGLVDGFLACFGLGKRRRREVEVEEYERYSHRGRNEKQSTGWFPVRTNRPAARKESHETRNTLAILGGLGALWAVLGLKRRHEQKDRREKIPRYEQSESSYSYSYDTSESSRSSDPRPVRPPQSIRRDRSMSRR